MKRKGGDLEKILSEEKEEQKLIVLGIKRGNEEHYETEAFQKNPGQFQHEHDGYVVKNMHYKMHHLDLEMFFYSVYDLEEEKTFCRDLTRAWAFAGDNVYLPSIHAPYVKEKQTKIIILLSQGKRAMEFPFSKP